MKVVATPANKRRRRAAHAARRRREDERHRELQQVERKRDGYSQDADLDDPTRDIFGAPICPFCVECDEDCERDGER